MSKTALLLGKSAIFKPLAWFKAYDNTHLDTRPDVGAPAGPPANNGFAGTWFDISGNANNFIAGINTNRPIWRSGVGLNFIDDPDGASVTQPSMFMTIPGMISTQNASGGMYVDFPGSNKTCVMDWASLTPATPTLTLRASTTIFEVYNGSGFVGFTNGGPVGTGPVTIGRQCILTWRSNGSAYILRVNGAEATMSPTIVPLRTDIQKATIGAFNGGNNNPIRFYELLVYDHDIGESGIISLENYLTAQAQSFTGITVDTTRTVVTIGDSTSQGVGSNLLKNVFDIQYINNRPASQWYEWNAIGSAMFQPFSPSATVNAVLGSNGGVVVIWMGTNDINAFGKTGAQTYTAVNNYATAVRSVSPPVCKVIVCTLQACGAGATVNPTEVGNFNTLIRAGYTGFADALVDLAARSELSNAADTTYYETDMIHLNDAGYAIAASLMQSALASV